MEMIDKQCECGKSFQVSKFAPKTTRCPECRVSKARERIEVGLKKAAEAAKARATAPKPAPVAPAPKPAAPIPGKVVGAVVGKKPSPLSEADIEAMAEDVVIGQTQVLAEAEPAQQDEGGVVDLVDSLGLDGKEAVYVALMVGGWTLSERNVLFHRDDVCTCVATLGAGGDTMFVVSNGQYKVSVRDQQSFEVATKIASQEVVEAIMAVSKYVWRS